jgi:hypothetical protein
MLLRECGFDVPRVLFAGFGGGKGFLVMEEVAGARDLLRLATEEFPESAKGKLSPEKVRQKRLLCELLGKTAGKLHALGIAHGDLRWGNIMIDESDPETPKIWLLDNERTVRRSRIAEKQRVKNLVQLNMFPPLAVGGTDRMRFFRAYLSRCPVPMPERKKLAAKVLKKTAGRLLARAAKRSGGENDG